MSNSQSKLTLTGNEALDHPIGEAYCWDLPFTYCGELCTIKELPVGVRLEINGTLFEAIHFDGIYPDSFEQITKPYVNDGEERLRAMEQFCI